jgi:hypothetical protein
MRMDLIYLCYNNDMNIVHQIEILETDVKDCNENCNRNNCAA